MLDVQGMARSAILNTREYIPGKPIEAVKRECGMDRIIKLNTNENPLGPSPLAVEAMIREIRESSHLYPESLCPELIAKLSARFNLPAASFYVGNGADAVITMMGLTCYRSSAIMVDVGQDTDLVFGELLKKGIIVRPLKGQGVETGLRITVGLMEENRMLIQALKDILF